MSELATIKSKTLSDIDLRFEEKRKIIEAEIEQSKQDVVDLFENYGFSPNAARDFEKVLLDDENNYLLPYALRIGNLLPKHNNSANDMLIPAILPFTNVNATALMIDREQNNEETIQHIFHSIAFRLMLSLPLRLCKFHFVDTLSFGEKFKIMNLLSDKIKTNAIINDEKRLGELIAELEQTCTNLTQNQLINYRSLEEYNKEAGTSAEPYRFVFISNFPYGFSKESAERFYRLINNQRAIKAGIFIFYSFSIDNEKDNEKNKNNAVTLPYGFDISGYMNISTLIYSNADGYYEIENTIFDKTFNDTFNIQLNAQLPYDLQTLIDAINRKADNVKPPVISFDAYFENRIKTGDYWKESTRLGIKIPVGKRPVDKDVFFELGGDTADYFAMIGGRPGFGKTVLLHNIICNGAIIYSPLELNYYLIDCTNGTGFKPYDKLPHATFVSITNQREYTVSALEHLINEMYQRAEFFKNAGEKLGTTIEKIEEYRKLTGEILPRLLVIIDEFQVLLENGDKISRKAGFYLEKIVREGRKYGMHIVFCTQSYRNLDFNTDMVTLRIAFNLKEYDSIKVLGGSNEEAAKLTQKGDAILNNKNGIVRDNIKFRCAYTEKMLEYVTFCNSKLSDLQGYSHKRFVFDGSIDSDLSTNQEFTAMLSVKVKGKTKSLQSSKIYIGVPSFIRYEHIYFKIRNNPCSNLLMVGSDVKAAMSSMMLANYQLAKQNPANSQFHIIDFLGADDALSKYYSEICEYIDNVHYCNKREMSELVDRIEQELSLRVENDNKGISNADRGRIILTLSYIQNAKELKKDGYKVSPVTEKLIKILKNGPDVGIHIMVYAYTCKGLEEVFERMTWNEFENRIVLAEGGGMAILSEQTAEPKGKGYGLIQTDDETATYNPDPFVFYNCLGAKLAGKDGNILNRIFSIYNQ
ncbi:MAG: FtsK/SpoIIIE domain-containing protein [Candidatus Azobacteroides sp.]|nr:FtsK/SpoIIIE domain-containing protein [Candidatus Azobacteroides sp.]